MSTFVYKNLLIIERNTDNVSSKNFLKLNKQFDFPDRKPFDYKSNKDKIILFSPINSLRNSIDKVYTQSFNITNNFKGVIKLLCDSHYIKVIDAQFVDYDSCVLFLNIFREYLITTIKNANANEDFKFYLYWDENILKNNTLLKSAVMSAKLIENLDKTFQVFNNKAETNTINMNSNIYQHFSF